MTAKPPLPGREGSPVLIRRMAPVDLDAAARLRWEAFFEGSDRTVADDRAGLAELVAREGPEAAFVSDADGRHAGSVLLVRTELSIDLDHSPWLAGLVVAPERRGRGLGAAMVRTVEAHAFEQGFEALYLYTHDADAFYAALGWTVLEEFTAFGEAARLMVRRR